ncbi:hypothetical protein ALC60_11215 [Trachymyrmex zeteki]|uniref:Uncharacterized protein n=1 Tax=Mycetomoellerius zeteki TaxID=64791 RepID=A0A151WPF4_9HYME|nr:hypothetical protein ALC60_11215 [Trachymyrmex zeteki]
MEEERSGNIFLLIYMELKLKLPSGLSTRPGHKIFRMNYGPGRLFPRVDIFGTGTPGVLPTSGVSLRRMTMEIYNDDGVSSRFCTIPAVATDSENDSTGNS